LIIQEKDKKFGIVVDNVDEIVTTTTNELVDVPSMTKDSERRLVSEDVKGCLRVPGRPAEADPVLVLDVAPLVQRCTAAEAA